MTMLRISAIESELWKIFQNTRVTKKARRICIMANRQSKLVEEQIEVGEEKVRVATIEGELFLGFTLGDTTVSRESQANGQCRSFILVIQGNGLYSTVHAL